MPSCTTKNKSACASSDERPSRILRGSDRSAKSELAPNCFGQIMCESYQRPLLPPGERPIMLHLGTRFVNAVATSNLEMFAGVAKKPQHRGAPIQGKPRGEG